MNRRTILAFAFAPSVARSDKYGMDEVERGSGSGLGYFVGFLGVACGAAAWRRYSREMSPSPGTLAFAAAAVGLFVLGAAIDLHHA